MDETTNRLYEQVSELLGTLCVQDAQVAALETRVASLTTLLELATCSPLDPTPNKQSSKQAHASKPNLKREFYKTYKDSPQVQEQIELFKKTFPQIKKIPWQLFKASTDVLYASTKATGEAVV